MLATASSAVAPTDTWVSRRRGRADVSAGRSRMAAMMFIRAMRMLVSTTARNEITKPAAAPSTRLADCTWKTMSSLLSPRSKALRMRTATTTTTRPTSRPSPAPRTVATAA